MPNTVTCKGCSKGQPDDMNYCPDCGEKLPPPRRETSPIGVTHIEDRIHGRNPKTGRSNIGEYIDRRKPLRWDK